MTTFSSASEAETAAIARDLASRLSVGHTVLIEGPLGAGKTAFVRGLAEGLGGDASDVSSPTFTLVQQYAGRSPLAHADLYRLKPIEVTDLGLDDYLEAHVLAVEWPDRWAEAPDDAIRVRITPTDGDGRAIQIECSGLADGVNERMK